MVEGALNSAARRYFLIFLTLDVVSFRQSITYCICELFSFRNLDFTNCTGYSLLAIKTVPFLQSTVSSIKSYIPSNNSLSYGYSWYRISISIFSRMISAYAWYSSAPASASSDTIRLQPYGRQKSFSYIYMETARKRLKKSWISIIYTKWIERPIIIVKSSRRGN